MKLRPLYDRVLLKRDAEEEVTTSGLFLPNASRERPQTAIVVATGQGRLRDDGTIAPMPVHVGDRVLIGKYSGEDLKIEGEAVMFLRVDEIIAIVDE